MDIFKLLGTIAINNSGANEAIDNTTDKAKSGGAKMATAFDNFGTGLETVGKKVATFGTKLTAAVSLPIVAALTGGVKYNAEMEKYAANLTTLLGGNAEKAASMLNDIKSMAAATPFETSDLISANNMLLAFGVSADKTKSYLSMLGDVSMGDKEKLSSLALAFGQIQSAGKMTGQDLLQMINAGFNPLQVISKQTGRSIADLKTDMEQGAISADMVTSAFESATGAGGLFYGAMDKASQTTAGKWSTMTDNIKTALGTLTTALMPTVEKVVDKVSELSNAFSNLSEGKREAILKIVMALAALGPVMLVVGKTTEAFGGAFKDVGKLMEKFPKFAAAMPWILGITAVIAVLMGLFALGKADTSEFGNKIQAMVTKVTTYIQNLAAKIVEAMPMIVEGIAKGMQNLTAVLPSIVTALVSIVTSLIQALTTILPTLIDTIVQLIVQLLPPLLDCILQIIQAIVDMLPTILPQLIDAIINLIMAIVNMLPTLIPLLINAIIQIINVIVEVLPSILQQLIGAIIMVVEMIAQMLPTLIPMLIDAALQLLMALVNAIPQILPPLLDGIVTLIQAIVNMLPTLIPQLVNAFLMLLMAIVNMIPVILPQLIQALIMLIGALIQALPTIIGALFSAVWTITKTCWGAMFTLLGSLLGAAWKWLYDTIFAPIGAFFAGIGQWFYDTVIAPIVGFFETWIFPIFAKIFEIVAKVFEIVTTILGALLLWLYNTFIAPIVAFVSGLIQSIVDSVSGFVNTIISFVSGLWDGITGIFGAVGSWFSNKFDEAVQAIKNVFSPIGDFFGGLWNTIKDKFSSLGTSIGDAIGGAVKSGINGIISLIEGTINKAIRLINGAINLVNKLPIGVNISTIAELSMPRLAKGGVATEPTIAEIGEYTGAKHNPEIVTPQNTMKAVFTEVLDAYASKLSDMQNETLNSILSLLSDYIPQLSQRQLVMDTGTVVGALAEPMNTALGKIATNRGRGR